MSSWDKINTNSSGEVITKRVINQIDEYLSRNLRHNDEREIVQKHAFFTLEKVFSHGLLEDLPLFF